MVFPQRQIDAADADADAADAAHIVGDFGDCLQFSVSDDDPSQEVEESRNLQRRATEKADADETDDEQCEVNLENWVILKADAISKR